MVGRRPNIPITVDDTGVGGGVSDKLRDMGAKVLAVNFGGTPMDKSKYTTVADELWFEFPIDDVDIPDDMQLLQELSGRLYDYTPDNRRKIEPKDKFKERYGRSPDKADGILLAFYKGGRVILDDANRKALAERRKLS